jgi:Na+/H+ antiporter NhaD/arsenite permease-like protein
MMIFALTVFLLVLAGFAFEIVHRTPAALLGAATLIIVGAISLQGAIEAVQWETLGLLVGMMILVGILKESGIFGYLAIKSAQFARGTPSRILIYLAVTTALLSAFLDNVTTILLMFPVTLVITRVLETDVIPFLITEVLASNIGGTATLVGDPPNIIIGTSVEALSFTDFIVNLAPVVAIILTVTLGIIWLVYGRRLQSTEDDKQGIMSLDANSEVKDRSLLIRAGLVMALTVFAFFTEELTGLNPAVIAISGAALAMLICSPSVEDVLHEVEWPTILFFVGLFAMVGALETTGFIARIADFLATASPSLSVTAVIVIWGSGLASGVVDNIPFTATMVPLLQQLQSTRGYSSQTMEPLWWSLSLGACLGGNLTLIGASANLVVSGLAEREGMRGFTFLRFLKWGLPLTLLALTISTVWILVVEIGL